MTTAYGYGRASLSKQTDSPDVQQEKIERYYHEKVKADVPQWGGTFLDRGISAVKKRLLMRDAGQELNRRLERGDHVIISRLDRVFRSFADFAHVLDTWESRGIYLHLVDRGVSNVTPEGKMILGILASVAQYEAAMISARTKDVMQWRKQQGLPVNGQAGYGFYWTRRGKEWVKVEDLTERKQMQWIVTQRLKGSTWEEMYFHLLQHGIRTRKGKEWSIMRIRRCFVAELYLQAQAEAKASSSTPSSSPAAETTPGACSPTALPSAAAS